MAPCNSDTAQMPVLSGMRETPREMHREMSCPLRTETASCSPQILTPRAAYQGYPVIHNSAHTAILSTFQTYNKKKGDQNSRTKNQHVVGEGGRQGWVTHTGQLQPHGRLRLRSVQPAQQEDPWGNTGPSVRCGEGCAERPMAPWTHSLPSNPCCPVLPFTAPTSIYQPQPPALCPAEPLSASVYQRHLWLGRACAEG